MLQSFYLWVKKKKSETETIESEEGPNGNEIIVGGHLLWICPKNNNLISIKLHSESLNKVDSKAIFSKLKLRRVSGEINLFETDTGVFKISSKGEFSQVYIGAETNFFTVASGKSDDKDNGSVVAIFQEANKEDSSVPISKIVWTLDISKQVSKTFQFPEIQAAGGSRGLVKNVYIQAVKVKASGLKSARVLVVFEDGSIVMLQLRESEKKASLLYVREEALSVISDVTSVELAVDEGSNDIHTEEIAKTFAHGNFFSILMLRMKDQIRVIKSTFASIFLSFFDYAKVVIESKGMIFVQMYKGTLPKSYQGYSSSAINSFGFKRGLVVLSKTGKLFLLNSINGEVLYGVFDPSLAIENDVDRSELIMTRHHSAGNDHPAEVAIVSSKNGRVQWRNVLTGAVLKTEYAPNKLKVISILPIHQDKVHRIEEGMKDKTKDSNDEEEVSSAAILVTVDENFKWHTYPKEKESFVRNSPSLLSKMHITYFEKKANSLNGYSLMGNGEAMQTWSYIIPQDEKLLKIQMQTEGAIANPGRKRGDGSILVKYLNNNLMMLASQNAKNEVLISILDGVSGRIIKRFSHRQARGPVHAVLFDNSVVYSFWNIVGKRQEISVVGLYEGSIDKRELNLWTPRSEEDIGMRPQFSSYDIENLVVKQRTFFVDKCISSLGISNTRHGIADRRVFIGMKNGGVNMQLRMFLDPLRPINKPTESETKELLPAYFPQLPIIPTSTITYNLTIANIDSIVSFPTKLESTTLVFVTGLDLFFSRAVPSKGFDVLNEDFSFTLLLLLSVSLLVGCVLLNNAVQSKQLNSAWK